MTTKLITCWTPDEPCPPYVNFTEDLERGVVTLRGRERAAPGMALGRDFAVDIDKAAFAKMVMEAGTTWLFPVKRTRTRKPLGER